MLSDITSKNYDNAKGETAISGSWQKRLSLYI